MQVDGSRRRGFQQGLARAEVVLRGACGQPRPLIDLSMCEPADSDVGEDVDGGIEDSGAALRVGWHQSV
ncbi:hypothetical protein [Mycobacterium pseudokansasii]|uniref:hypothetical protein n=1 Tax=Mycobacterium pseudokansasii TaxID=2341080 RepID=UPI001FEA7095|nr:hypothetical protein [Mycobacterium pseudokansasii]